MWATVEMYGFKDGVTEAQFSRFIFEFKLIASLWFPYCLTCKLKWLVQFFRQNVFFTSDWFDGET